MDIGNLLLQSMCLSASLGQTGNLLGGAAASTAHPPPPGHPTPAPAGGIGSFLLPSLLGIDPTGVLGGAGGLGPIGGGAGGLGGLNPLGGVGGLNPLGGVGGLNPLGGGTGLNPLGGLGPGSGFPSLGGPGK